MNRRLLQKHILFWAIIVSYLNLYSPVPGSWLAKVIGGGLESLNYMFVFYSFSLVIFPRFWKKQRLYLIVSILISFILYFTITYLNYLKVIPLTGGNVYYQRYSLWYLVYDDSLYFFIIGLAGSASFFYRRGIHKIKLQSEKEKVLLIKELNFLKNQFNSHITFNFLNYCYSKIHIHSCETAESIELFSDFLRLTLKNKSKEKVTITDEISKIENFINLHKCIFPDVCVNITCEGEVSNKFILSGILFTFVENAFNHGIFNNPLFPIKVELLVNTNGLSFTVKHNIIKKDNSNYNINLENAIQLLDLYYIHSYEFKREETEDGCILKLEIKGIDK